MSGFDYVSSSELGKLFTSYNGQTVSSPVRTGAYAYRHNTWDQNSYKTFGVEDDTFVCGAAVYFTGTFIAPFFNFCYDTNQQVGLRPKQSTRELEVITGSLSQTGGTVLGTSTYSLNLSTWYYIEFKVYIHDTAGTAEVRVNGSEWINITNVDTKGYASSAYANTWLMRGSSGGYTYIDDLYVLDTNGSVNNDFLGDVKIEVIRPTGAGNSTDFTPSTGSNWQNVDDTTPDDDSTYNYHAPQGLPGTDLFQMGDLTTISGSVFAIQPIMYARKDDAGSADLYSVLRTGGTDYVGSGISLPDSYIYHTDIVEENPNTATAWTVTDINNIEGGYRRTS